MFQGDNPGFDCVIGNPPYIRQERIINLKNFLRVNYKEVYWGTADLSTYFVNLCIQKLRDRGYHSYIITNKWLRAKYGENLREYLSKQTRIVKIIDLTGTKVFKDAGVDVLIYIIRKEKPENGEFDYCLYGGKKVENIVEKVDSKFSKVEQRKLGKNWTLQEKEVIEVKEYIDSVGTRIKNTEDINLYFGIKTGFNEAFIIDRQTKERLTEEDPNSAEIIKPLLRGRDIRRWKIEFANIYLLATDYDVNIPQKYPAIYNHLLKYEDKARKRYDQGKNWWNLRTCDYYDEFEKPKIIYPNISEKLVAYLDYDSFYTNQKCYILTSLFNELIGIIFNSKLMNFYFKLIGAKLGSSGFEMNKIFIEQLPILKNGYNHIYSKIVNIIQHGYTKNSKKEFIFYIDHTITDNLIYELYFFEEKPLIKQIEKHFKKNDEFEIYHSMKQNKKIGEIIQRIQNHKYVKVIEKSVK